MQLIRNKRPARGNVKIFSPTLAVYGKHDSYIAMHINLEQNVPSLRRVKHLAELKISSLNRDTRALPTNILPPLSLYKKAGIYRFPIFNLQCYILYKRAIILIGKIISCSVHTF
ncbi:hypothetical protein PUN28_017326 [Cardiocondyla obscurior]|uniref:Uncharacterized protein n=1 Tax=Cardiocondyla obscurior TaxID=286306 RepID=A0AAW2ELC7_9HYME